MHFCRSFANQAVASFSSFSLHRQTGAHRLPLRVCGRCIGSFSIHAYARAALLPPYHAWLNGAHAKRSLPCTGVPYAAWRKAERHPLLASPLTPPPAPQMTWCTILRLLANAQDAQATSEIRKWTFAEVSFFRGAPRSCTYATWCRVAGPEELRATKLVEVALCRLSFASLCLECLSSEPLH